MRFRRFTNSYRRFFWALAALLPLQVGAGAAAEEVFTVRNVPVDATAAAAATARDAAIEQGYLDAFDRLTRRLVPQEGLGRVPVLTARQIADYTLDFSVARERTSSVRYLADITYRFRPDEIRSLLRNHGIGFAETASKPVVVLALQEIEGAPVLWDGGNLWREAWSLWQSGGGLVPMIVPLGDLSDISSITAEEAVSGDIQRLSSLAERYGADSTLVSRAVLSGSLEAGTAGLGISSTRYDGQGTRLGTDTQSLQQNPAEPGNDFLLRAVEVVNDAIQEEWKRANVLQYGVESIIQVAVPLNGLDDWAQVQKRLAGVPAVVDKSVNAITRQKAEMTLTYVGDERQLTLALAQKDLTLMLNETLAWELRLSEQEPPVQGRGAVQVSPEVQPDTDSLKLPDSATSSGSVPNSGRAGGAPVTQPVE